MCANLFPYEKTGDGQLRLNFDSLVTVRVTQLTLLTKDDVTALCCSESMVGGKLESFDPSEVAKERFFSSSSSSSSSSSFSSSLLLLLLLF